MSWGRKHVDVRAARGALAEIACEDVRQDPGQVRVEQRHQRFQSRGLAQEAGQEAGYRGSWMRGRKC